MDSFVLARVLGGATEFRTNPADHYRALAHDPPLTWSDDHQAWICLSSDLVSTVLRDPVRYHRAPAWEPEPDAPSEVQTLRNTWLEFSKGVPHRTARTGLMSAVAHAHDAEGWSRLTTSIGRLVAALPGGNGTVDLVSALSDPLWQALLCDWFGLTPSVAADQHWLTAVADAVSGPLDTVTSRRVVDLMRHIAESATAIRETGQWTGTLLDALAQYSEPGAPEMVVAARMLNLMLDASPVSDAVILCLHDILTDAEVTGYFTDRAAENDIEGVHRGLVEVLRRDPVQTFTVRFATEDHLLGEEFVAKDNCLLVVLGAANNDPRAYEAPTTFDPGRTTLPVSFGLGLHSCIGRRYTIDVLSNTIIRLLRRFPRMSLAESPEWAADEAALRRLIHCPVRLPA